jgi:hypothetical protein
MTQQIVCDECGEPIDISQPYYELIGSKVHMVGDPPTLTVAEPAKTMHYHENHLPGSVLDPAFPDNRPVDPEFGQPTPDPDPPQPTHPIVYPDEPVEGPPDEPDDNRDKDKPKSILDRLRGE